MRFILRPTYHCNQLKYVKKIVVCKVDAFILICGIHFRQFKMKIYQKIENAPNNMVKCCNRLFHKILKRADLIKIPEYIG